uniref:Uncharacterized protein n=1 Tax=Romanomermis culicivorax TaxID=13658 RepID=A0A915IMS6_ROMCU
MSCNSVTYLKLTQLSNHTQLDFIAQSKCYGQVYEDDVDECESGDKCLPYKTNMINYVHEKMRRTGNISWEEGIQYVTRIICHQESHNEQMYFELFLPREGR